MTNKQTLLGSWRGPGTATDMKEQYPDYSRTSHWVYCLITVERNSKTAILQTDYEHGA